VSYFGAHHLGAAVHNVGDHRRCRQQERDSFPGVSFQAMRLSARQLGFDETCHFSPSFRLQDEEMGKYFRQRQ
jgi:hypothetical protein